MPQQYDNSGVVNLPKDIRSDVLAAIVALEAEGFYPGSDDISVDIKVVTLHDDWEIKAGWAGSLLHVTVSLGDRRWLLDLEDCEEDLLPTNRQLLETHPKILNTQLARLKQQKYERMMRAVAWVKAILDQKIIHEQTT